LRDAHLSACTLPCALFSRPSEAGCDDTLPCIRQMAVVPPIDMLSERKDSGIPLLRVASYSLPGRTPSCGLHYFFARAGNLLEVVRGAVLKCHTYRRIPIVIPGFASGLLFPLFLFRSRVSARVHMPIEAWPARH